MKVSVSIESRTARCGGEAEKGGRSRTASEDGCCAVKVSGGGDAQCELIECLNKIMTLL